MKIFIAILSAIYASMAYSQNLDSVLSEHQRQREAVLRPLEAKYDAELAKLLQKLTAAGNFKELVEVDKVIKERLSIAPTFSAIGTWIWPDNKKLVLSSDGKATFSAWTGDGKWKAMDDQKIEVTNPDGKSGTLKMLPHGKGIYTSGANNQGGVSVTKQK